MNDYQVIMKKMSKGEYAPLYFLMGEESFFINQISDYIVKNALKPQEKDFGLDILYGNEINVSSVIAAAREYPIFGNKKVVVVREAQKLSNQIEKLVNYTEHFLESTILVICYKYKLLDKRKKLYRSLIKNGIVFESKKMYENQVVGFVERLLIKKGYKVEFKAIYLLVERLGTDLNKISKELEKLEIILEKHCTVDSDVISKYVGISKEYNVFELRNAIGKRDIKKTLQIVSYFQNNPKENPLVVVLSQLFGFFIQIVQYHCLNDKSPNNIAKILGIHPYFVKDIEFTATQYSLFKTRKIISEIRRIDLKNKGYQTSSVASSGYFLKELVYKIMA